MNIRRTLPLRSLAVFNSSALTSSVNSILLPPRILFLEHYTTPGQFSFRKSLRYTKNSMQVKETSKKISTPSEIHVEYIISRKSISQQSICHYVAMWLSSSPCSFSSYILFPRRSYLNAPGPHPRWYTSCRVFRPPMFLSSLVKEMHNEHKCQ